MRLQGNIPGEEEAGLIPILHLKPGRHRVLAGCPWIFRGELTDHDPPEEPEVEVVDADGRFVGRGLYSPKSAIAVRMLAWSRRSPIDGDLLVGRVARAVAARPVGDPATQAVRLVNAEADGVPGLVVDRFGPMIVVEVTFAPLVRWLPAMVEQLAALPGVVGVYERGRLSVRQHEGLPLEDRLLWGRLENPVTVVEHGLRYRVDVARGQKTGHYLDQAQNRLAAARWAGDREVLDVFAHTGGFALTALAQGARRALAVDQDGEALAVAEENAAANGLADRFEGVEANAFDWLRQAAQSGTRYDMVILDPPAFTKSREAVAGALRGYKEINLRAAKLLRPGGILVTCSCSYHVDLDTFIEVVGAALFDAHRESRILEVRGQAPDHPSHPLLPETRYLKCLIVAVD
jgi:23S rRNA (cytosine1962-C5)-methyltransferase